MSKNVMAECVSTETLIDLLRWRAEHQPDRLAYTFLRQGEEVESCLTYAELDQLARALGSLLQTKGAAGEPVLLLQSPGIHYIAAIFGCMYAGAIAVPAYPPHSARMMPRIQAILDSTQSRFIVTTSETLTGLQRSFAFLPVPPDLQWVTVDSVDLSLAAAWQKPSVDRETLAVLQYTSGSTATPKGVKVSYGNLQHNLAMVSQHCKQTPESHMVSWAPPYHDMGLIGSILYPFYIGFPSTLMSPMAFLQRPLRWLRTISNVHATMSMAPNFAYELCCRKIAPEQRSTLDLSSWLVAASGGEPPRYETMKRFTETFASCGYRPEAFLLAYGMAETTLIVATSHADLPPMTGAFDKEALERDEAISRPIDAENVRCLMGYELRSPDQEMLIVDAETMTPCPEGRVGEIWVRGPSITQGYWQNPEETLLTYQAYLASTGAGPFLRTGDLGFLQDGILFVAGRLKDLIIVDGRNHYPQDIELTIERCSPAIRQGCCVAFSIEVNNTEQLVVLAEIEPGYQPLQAPTRAQGAVLHPTRPCLDPQNISSAIRQAITEEHELQTYQVVLLKAGGVLKTSSGKLQRQASRTAFLTGKLNRWDE
jgi:acyl-CoA synthetase (AMP-forming)/AMP-acid ligase II